MVGGKPLVAGSLFNNTNLWLHVNFGTMFNNTNLWLHVNFGTMFNKYIYNFLLSSKWWYVKCCITFLSTKTGDMLIKIKNKYAKFKTITTSLVGSNDFSVTDHPASASSKKTMNWFGLPVHIQVEGSFMSLCGAVFGTLSVLHSQCASLFHSLCPAVSLLRRL